MNIKPYAPNADSVAAKVIAFFRFNGGEELLTMEDIVSKFDCKRGNIHTMLLPAKDAGLIVRKQDEDGDYYYGIGPLLLAELAAPSDASAPLTSVSKSTQPKMLDISTLVVETGVPYTPIGNKGESKWDPLFSKLTKADQSVSIPRRVKPAVAAAVIKVNKKGGALYRVAITSKTEARVWRTK